MNFYNPQAPKNGSPPIAAQPYTPPAYVAGRATVGAGMNTGAVNPNGPQNAGNSMWDTYGRGSSVYHQLSDPGWSTGETFQANSKIEALDALKKAQTNANPDDYAAMSELRNAYRTQLADVPGATADNISSFNSQSQNGLRSLLSQYKNANAGKGTMGSRQYGGAQGDIMSRANTDYMNGLLKARSDGIDQTAKLGAGLSGVQAQDLAERNFQNDQASNYANLIANFMAQDQGRESQLSQQKFQKEATNEAMKYQAISNERKYGHEFGMNMAGAGMGGGGG